MPANEWTMPAQKRYLMSKLTAYMAATDISNHKALHRFWVTLNEGWFELFPVQTTTSLVAISDEIEKTKEPFAAFENVAPMLRAPAPLLVVVMAAGAALVQRWPAAAGGGRASKTRSLFSILKRTKEIRPYRPIEVYQKVYNLKISQEVMARGYGLLDEEMETAAAAASASSSADIVILTDEEIRAAAEKETEAYAAEAAIELYDAEDDEVKAEIKAEMEAMNAERVARAGGDTDESTPEDYQHQFGEATGWHLCLLAGGPMPNRAGAIPTKTICYGTMALGNNFQALHPSFDDSVKAHFNKFLKRAFPHDVRDARGIVDNSQGIAGAIAIDDEGDDETPAVGEASKSKPPKRIRHPKRATAALAPGPAVPPAVLLPTSNVVSVPTDAADLSEPDAIADSPLPIPAGFDEPVTTIVVSLAALSVFPALTSFRPLQTMDAIASEYDASADIPFGWDGAGLDLGGVTVQHATFDAAGEDLIVGYPGVIAVVQTQCPAAGIYQDTGALVGDSLGLKIDSSLEGEAAVPPGPHYIVSRPMANPPKAPAPAGSCPRGRPPGRGRGRGRRKQGVSRNDVGTPESAPPVDENSTPMSAEAWEESARIHREEAAQWKDRAELRKREKVMEEKEAASTAAANHCRNPSGGADLMVVEHPKRAVKAALNLDGTPVIRPVQRTRAELAGSRVAIGVIDPNVQQAKVDAELLKRLNGKGKGKEKRKAEEAPAPKTWPTKRARRCSCTFIAMYPAMAGGYIGLKALLGWSARVYL
ncbi:hypothetical protein B0H14DRAFT_2646077 [Mycena olivaceomarginata]|nr:hypothetical protein B0H14DRAFT_2646077 [Mycena olivaceomarginata]